MGFRPAMILVFNASPLIVLAKAGLFVTKKHLDAIRSQAGEL